MIAFFYVAMGLVTLMQIIVKIAGSPSGIEGGLLTNERIVKSSAPVP